jgi:hypothetical protein
MTGSARSTPDAPRGGALPRAAARDRNQIVLLSLCAAQVLLMISTWPLWWGSVEFPVVPLVSGFSSLQVYVWVSRLLTLTLLAGVAFLAAAAGKPVRARVAVPVVICAAVLAVNNQHRLQPWHWLFLLMITQLCLLTGRQLTICWRWTLVTIYVCSALSRVTVDAGNSMSSPMIQVVTGWLLPAAMRPDANSLQWISLVLAALELAIGIMLLVPRCRKAGIVAAVCMHLLLLLVLSPLGLNHHWGVLIWNTFLAVCIPLLFWESGSRSTPSADKPAGSAVLWCLITVTVAFPLSGLFGVADNWPSWQVYSPRPESFLLVVRTDAVDQLPDTIQRFVGQPQLLSDWCPVQLDRWSLEAVRAPMYPEDRFNLAIIRQLAAQLPDGTFRVEVDRPAIPTWWRRQRKVINSHQQLAETVGDFWFPANVLVAERK